MPSLVIMRSDHLQARLRMHCRPFQGMGNVQWCVGGACVGVERGDPSARICIAGRIQNLASQVPPPHDQIPGIVPREGHSDHPPALRDMEPH